MICKVSLDQVTFSKSVGGHHYIRQKRFFLANHASFLILYPCSGWVVCGVGFVVSFGGGGGYFRCAAELTKGLFLSSERENEEV